MPSARLRIFIGWAVQDFCFNYQIAARLFSSVKTDQKRQPGFLSAWKSFYPGFLLIFSSLIRIGFL